MTAKCIDVPSRPAPRTVCPPLAPPPPPLPIPRLDQDLITSLSCPPPPPLCYTTAYKILYRILNFLMSFQFDLNIL